MAAIIWGQACQEAGVGLEMLFQSSFVLTMLEFSFLLPREYTMQGNAVAIRLGTSNCTYFPTSDLVSYWRIQVRPHQFPADASTWEFLVLESELCPVVGT